MQVYIVTYSKLEKENQCQLWILQVRGLAESDEHTEP